MQTYQNPLMIPQQDPERGLGDPFVFRFNGKYYLCPSPAGIDCGVLLWESTDLCSWQLLGNIAPDELLENTYAPEIFYYNGTFYLTGSPRGEGHYFYTAASPEGPYERLTDNIGQTIDGSLFADDDGSLYFYHAEYPSIHGHRMHPDGQLEPGEELYGTSMGHWTEGPGVFKRGDLYYITMTGNHLLSRAYRIDYAYSDKGPLGPFRTPRNKTLLVNTAYQYGSLGHSSSVIGPDLDSYWIFYHSFLIEQDAERREHTRRRGRFVHMDRMLFNGDELCVSGPGLAETPAPEMPEFYGWADRDTEELKFIRADSFVLSAREMSARGTAEITFVPGAHGAAVFAWQDAAHYHRVRLDSEMLRVEAIRNEKIEILFEKPLFKGFREDVMHTLRLEADEENTTIFVDQMEQGSIPAVDRAGRIGTENAVRSSYTAFTRQVHQSSDRLYYQYVPGFLGGMTAAGGGKALACADGETRRLLRADESVTFRINVTEDADYHLQAVLQALENTGLQWHVESGCGEKQLPLMGSLQRVELGTIRLQKGCQEWSLSVQTGAVQLRGFDLFPAAEPIREELSGLALCRRAVQLERDICIDRAAGLQMDRLGQVLCRFGSRFHTEESIETDMIFRGDAMETSAGIFLRVSEDSSYPEQVPIGHRGYYIGFDGGGVFIWRMNFDRKILAEARFPVRPEIPYRIRGEIHGNEITAYVNGQQILSATDDDSLPFGAVGVGSFGSRVSFTHVKFDLK